MLAITGEWQREYWMSDSARISSTLPIPAPKARCYRNGLSPPPPRALGEYVTERVRTPGGRTLAVEVSGDPNGSPIFLLHGTPGCRLGPRPRGMLLHHLGVRLFSFDRPGYGGSHRQLGRRVADAAADVEAIADAYGLDRFAVVGRSGGGPHALACAALLSNRITCAAVLVSLAPQEAEGLDWFHGMASSNVSEFTAAAAGHWHVTPRLTAAADEIRANPERLLLRLRTELPDSDRRIISDARIRTILIRCYAEALRISAAGWIDDVVALCTPWGFDPAMVTVPVLLWHGYADRFTPVSHAIWLAETIPNATAILHPSAAHFGALDALPDILHWLNTNSNAIRQTG